jgi:peptide/nickel transport system ATP-binding protein
MHLIESDAGDIRLGGKSLGVGGHTVRELRRQMQMVFQDSYASLNPRLAVQDSIAFGPMAHGVEAAKARAKARELLALVNLDPDQFGRRYPHELSGGQRQRVNFARALALEPRLVILDEAVSALDKSIEAQVLNLLMDLKKNLQLTYLFISHDLSVVQYVSDQVLVMYLGKVVELGPVDDVYHRPRHPYTRALLASRPSMDPDKRLERSPLAGDPPNPINPPSGCRFRTRCAFAESVCEHIEPLLTSQDTGPGHSAACHMVIPGSGHSKAPGGLNAGLAAALSPSSAPLLA